MNAENKATPSTSLARETSLLTFAVVVLNDPVVHRNELSEHVILEQFAAATFKLAQCLHDETIVKSFFECALKMTFNGWEIVEGKRQDAYRDGRRVESIDTVLFSCV